MRTLQIACVSTLLTLCLAPRAAWTQESAGIGWGGPGVRYKSAVTAFNQLSWRTRLGIVVDYQKPWSPLPQLVEILIGNQVYRQRLRNLHPSHGRPLVAYVFPPLDCGDAVEVRFFDLSGGFSTDGRPCELVELRKVLSLKAIQTLKMTYPTDPSFLKQGAQAANSSAR
jgi:hypothetical protein